VRGEGSEESESEVGEDGDLWFYGTERVTGDSTADIAIGRRPGGVLGREIRRLKSCGFSWSLG
jgi:hypothetical protein